MNENWIEDYNRLALRLNRAIDARQPSMLLDYFGPPDWQAQVNGEPVWSPETLLDETHRLEKSIDRESFAPQRARYLRAHLRAFETVARRLRGDDLSLQEEVQGCFDLQVDWLPESTFEQAYALYDRTLPGQGDLAGRLRRWKAQWTLPAEKSPLLMQSMEKALAHARQQTHDALPLPAGEQVALAPVYDQPVWGLAAYQGDHRSQILINPKVPFPLSNLFYVLCHEGYPGHLTEILLKEEVLVRRQGCLEQQVHFLLTPAYVISEGIALLAREMIFAPGEEERWLAEHILPGTGIDPETCDLTGIFRARDLLRGVSCNAAFLVRAGQPERDVLDYLMRYALLDENGARNELAALQRPFFEGYIFTYYHGRRLLEHWLSGEQRQANLLRLLTSQVLPSDLAGENERNGAERKRRDT